jgi:hypothetical protein
MIFEFGGGGDELKGKEEELIGVDELCREAEGLAGDDGVGDVDERKLRMGRDSTELDRAGGSSWMLSS